MTDLDCKTVQGPDGEWYTQIPEGFLLCLVPKELAERFADWTECEALRVVTGEGGTVASLEVTNDLEALTEPTK